MSEEEMRLGCLRAALDLRTAGSTAEELLALAERFYRFVGSKVDTANQKPTRKQTGTMD